MERGGVELSLSLASTSYSVGETVTAVLHALPSEDIWTDLQDLEIVFCGVERVDTAWVSRTYRKSVPPINDDKRRVQRLVILSRLQAATQGNFSDADFRRFIIRFTIPSWLPPSYKGTAVRYSYYMEAIMRYKKEAPDPSLQLPSSGVEAEVSTATVRFQVVLWPGKEVAPSSGGLEAAVASLNGGSSSGGDVFPPLASESMTIKCWEIGPGTAIDDALVHISNIANMRPSISMGSMVQTPSFLHREDSRVEASETGSEISHDDRQQQQQATQQPLQSQQPSQSRLNSGQIPELEPVGSLQADLGAYKSFSLRTGPHQVARISVQPPLEGVLRPGATLGGTIEFPNHIPLAPQPDQLKKQGEESEDEEERSDPPPRCIQLSLMLESEETVSTTWRPSGKAGAPGLLRRLHDEQIDATANLGCTSFMFTLPQDATPTFQTQLLSLKWVLRFQFTLQHAGGGTEQLSWSLPVAVESPV